MRIYISADLEGVNGVCKFSQTFASGGDSYKRAVEQLHMELNTIIHAAFEVGIDEITINDAHSSMTNLTLDALNDKVSLITGKPKACSMVATLDDSYDGLFLVGYHAKANTGNAILAHTFTDDFTSLKINGKEVGESFVNSAYAGSFGVPVCLITGDNVLHREIYTDIGDVPFVETKKALGMTACQCKPNDVLFNELREKTIETLKNPVKWILNTVNSPYTLEIEFVTATMADLAELIPMVNRTGPRSISFIDEDFGAVYKAIQTIGIVASTANAYY